MAEEMPLQYTPTWIVAAVCASLVAASLIFELALYLLKKWLQTRGNNKNLDVALKQFVSKMKEELVLLGFITLLMAVLQQPMQKICVPEKYTRHLLICKLEDERSSSNSTTAAGARRLLKIEDNSHYCQNNGKVPLLSVEAIHQLHIFIFVLALTHIISSILTLTLGRIRIGRWKHWEEEESKKANGSGSSKVTPTKKSSFIKNHYNGFGAETSIKSYMISFLKQFWHPISQIDYKTMRHGFIVHCCNEDEKFNFYEYMLRALLEDAKELVGVNWYMWIFVVIFLLLDVHGWHTYFWISFIPLVLLTAIGTKLEHIIVALAHRTADKESAHLGLLVVQPSPDLFSFYQPRRILLVLNFILFHNAFLIAYFFWSWAYFGFRSCILDGIPFITIRLVVCVIVLIHCSYNILPLFAIVSPMSGETNEAVINDLLKKDGMTNDKQSKEDLEEGIQLQNLDHAHTKIAESSNTAEVTTRTTA